jgi:hypothetical protein
MQKLVPTIAGLTLLVSAIITEVPRSTLAADTGNVPVASWPHTILTDEATIVVYQPQAIVWKEYRTLVVRTAVAVARSCCMSVIPIATCSRILEMGSTTT